MRTAGRDYVPVSLTPTTAAMPSDVTGVVVWFSDAKGFGFVRPDQPGPDVFVHYSAVHGSGRRTLLADQRVQYTLGTGPDGRPAAQQVTVLP